MSRSVCALGKASERALTLSRVLEDKEVVQDSEEEGWMCGHGGSFLS